MTPRRTRQIILLGIMAFWAIVFIALYKPRVASKDNTEPKISATSEYPAFLGTASWYSYKIGDDYDSSDHYVCASRDFPRYAWLEVSANNKTSHCLVTDFGPEEWTGRILDLSPRVFSELAPLSQGLIKDVYVHEVGK